MKFRIGLIAFIFCLNFWGDCKAQNIDREIFHRTDSLVAARGAMPDSSLKNILLSITPLCQDQACIIRAIYMWVCKNISRDCNGERHADVVNNSASFVFRERKATSIGFANLIAEMCRITNIRCEVVTGVAKWEPDHIGHVDKEDNRHAWNTVLVNGRWFVIDASWGAGNCSGKRFSAELTDAWFGTNRKLFALCHFPDEKRQQLLDTPLDRSAFISAPLIGPIASILGIIPSAGQRGILRGRADTSIQLTFTMNPQYIDRVSSASVLIGGETTQIPWSKDGAALKVKIPFPEKGKYPIQLLVNGGNALTFQAQVAGSVKKRKRESK